MYELAAELYPICRSITGDGLRTTLRRIASEVPIDLYEVPSGTAVFDWTVPREWNIRDAYIKDANGRRVVDFHASNLHVLNYSVPVHRTMRLAELKPHLYTLPDRPAWIPYRTSYYAERWGFCLAHEQFLALPDGEYQVCIDSSLEDGHLTYGEYFLPGDTEDEVLISCHTCHPSLCNDNLSGIAVAAFLAKHLASQPRRLSYRFLFLPGTIGAITWLALHQEHTQKIKHGIVLTCVGDAGAFHYKRSRRGNAVIDRAFAHVLSHSGVPYEILDFSPYGYDERQYCSAGFNLAVGCLMRSVHGTFPEYHTSADNLEFVKPGKLEESLRLCMQVMEVLEHDRVFLNQKPFCEAQLGSRGLYRSTGGESIGIENLAKLWILNLSDGGHSLLDIAERSGIPFCALLDSTNALLQTDLLRPLV